MKIFALIALVVSTLCLSITASFNIEIIHPFPESETLTPSPTIDPTPTQEIFNPSPTPEPRPHSTVYVNNQTYAINLRAGSGISFSDIGDLQPGQTVGLLDNSRGNGWLGVCLFLADGDCAGSYYVAGWLLEIKSA